MKNPMKHDKPDKPEPAVNQTPHWTDRWRNAVPTRSALAAHPWLKPIAHHVLDPKLWRMHHETVARGAAMTADGKIVYCVRAGNGATDLRLLDGTVTPATDTALTTDGKSCDPRY